MNQWHTTTDTRVAAACGTLGIVIRLLKSYDDRSGKGQVRFSLGLASVEKDYQTGALLHGLKAGTLPAAHPLLTILRACENRRLLLDLANRGKFCELVPVPGAPGIWHYQPAAAGLPGIGAGVATYATGDLKLAASLALAGIPLLRLDGPEGRRTYHLAAAGPPRPELDLPAVDAAGMAAEWRADRAAIPFADPVAQGLRGLYNRERLLDAVNGAPEVVLLRRGVRKVTIRSDAAEPAWDRVSRFLG